MRRLLIIVPAILLFSTILSAQEWNDVRSPNLHILTNGSTKQATNALWKLEQLRVVFGHQLNRGKLNKNRPLLILGLESPAEVRELAGDAKPVPGGFAYSADDRNYLVIDLSATDWSGIYRAYALLLLDANYPRTQSWFDEGLAQYIGGLDIESKQISEGIPSRIANEVKTGELLPVEKLIGPNAQAPQFAATSYVFVRWLIENGEFENAGPYFNQVMNRSVTPENAFQQVFSVTPAEMDAVLAKYRTTLGSKAVAPTAEVDTLSFVPTKVADGEVKAIKEQVKLEQPSLQAAAFDALLKMQAQNADNVEVHRGLGIAYLRRGDMQNFADHIRRAIEIRDDSGMMHYFVAVWRNRGSREAVQVDSEGPTIMMQCEKALDLDPELAMAYQLLSEGQMATRHPEKALTTIRKGMLLAPRDERLMLTFASAQIANSKYDEVRGLLKFLETSENKSVSSRATEMMASANRLRKSEAHWTEQGMKYSDPTNPKWKPKEEEATAPKTEEKPAEVTKPDTRKTEYLKGTLVSVMCPDTRSAMLTVVANRKTWKFAVPDRSTALLIGADKFDCDWKNVRVSVNYRASGAAQGDLVSLEVD